ncbi:MAG: hypothetical protein ONB44_19050 [candidate division KSB1 bacterium]|nr:hypothetical protein [candidate division KSB1 bacterium]MDZ7304227.1 hypothetical protein [candidate division KSB1 bacterium]MDZ7311702.1 hypothetical protein [candidate division KSB1 bacterium]
MNFAVKIYPRTLWGERYRGNFDQLTDEIAAAGIQNLIVPAFQGSRIFFIQQFDQEPNPWSLVPLQEQCAKKHLGFAVEFPICNDRDTFERLPEYRPQSPDGTTFPQDSWYRPICPSHLEYKQHRLHLIEGAIANLKPALALINFLWFPFLPSVEGWEEMGSQVPSFCLCPQCRQGFSDRTGLVNPLQDIEAWFAFRAEQISNFLADIEELSTQAKTPPSLLLELPPVATPHFAERLRRLTGLHLEAIRKLVNVLSPQLFYNEHGQSPAWVLAVLDELARYDFSLFPQIDFPDLHSMSVATSSEDHLHELVFIFQALEARRIGAAALFHWENLVNFPRVLNIIEQFSYDIS